MQQITTFLTAEATLPQECPSQRPGEPSINGTSANHNIFNEDHTEDFTFANVGTLSGNDVVNPFNDKAVTASYKTGWV